MVCTCSVVIRTVHRTECISSYHLCEPGVCNFNCPDANTEPIIRRIQETGITTLRDLSALTHNTYPSATLACNEVFKLYTPPSSFSHLLPDCGVEKGRPGPSSVLCIVLASSFIYPQHMNVQFISALYDLYWAGGAGGGHHSTESQNADQDVRRCFLPKCMHMPCSIMCRFSHIFHQYRYGTHR